MGGKKKYLVAACALSAAAAVPTAAHALGAAGTRKAATSAAASHSAADPAPVADKPMSEHVRVVDPGEKVAVAPGTKLWLTKDRKVCWQHGDTLPDCWTTAHRTGTGTNETAAAYRPGQVTTYGSYNGPSTPAGVTSTAAKHTTQGTVLTLTGNPGWGTFFITQTPRPQTPTPHKEHPLGTITIHDTTGHTIATTHLTLSTASPPA